MAGSRSRDPSVSAAARISSMRLRGLTNYHGETGLTGLTAWLRGEREPAVARASSPSAPTPIVPTAPAATPTFTFDINHPATGPNFIGRTAERAEFDSYLAQGGGCSLVGDSRIGKSSLLLAWRDRALHAGHEAHVIDFQTTACTYPAFLHAATDGKITPPANQTLTADTAADLLATWAATLPKPPVLLLDETEAAIRTLDHRFFERLRGLMPRVLFMIGTRLPLPEVFQKNGATSPFANLLITWKLGLLDDQAAAQLASHAGEHAGLLRHWCGNHPFYLQALGQWLQKVGPTLTLEEALRRFCDTAADRYTEAYQWLGPKAKAALDQAATGLAVDHNDLKTRGWLTPEGPKAAPSAMPCADGYSNENDRMP